jgi:putative tryptophan/tyrosine transport system substrate-binding protein
VRGLNRRRFIQGAGLVGLTLLTDCGPPSVAGESRSVQSQRVPRIGFFSVNPQRPSRMEAFVDGLRQHGYVPGENIGIEWRSGDGRAERLPAIAAELVHLPVDVLVASGNPSVFAARDATTTVPVVMAYSANPVGQSIVASLARPSGNVTGLSGLIAQLEEKRLELFKDTAPELSRVAALWDTNLGEPGLPWRQHAGGPGLQLELFRVSDRAELEVALDTARQHGADGLYLAPSAAVTRHASWIAEQAIASKLPTMAAEREMVEAGILLSYGPSIPALWQRAAYYVDRILRGAKPADLPIEQPREFELVINLKTAHALDLAISERVLLQATEIIQ